MTLHEKLADIQFRLKAPKDLNNTFGKFKYRSAESIIEAAKPLLNGHALTLTLSDSVEQFGDRLFLCATATIRSVEEWISVRGYAEIPPDKKGMDASQITGAASSYARKYALNGLFCIDDTKDADSEEYQNTQNAPAPLQVSQPVQIAASPFAPKVQTPFQRG